MELKKEVNHKEDGRKIIYYSFTDKKEKKAKDKRNNIENSQRNNQEVNEKKGEEK